MSLMRAPDELDRAQKLLEEEFPECKVGYSYRPGHVTWTAQLPPPGDQARNQEQNRYPERRRLTAPRHRALPGR
jgi:hypothetical protein